MSTEVVQAFHEIGNSLTMRGASAVLLACTELELLTHERELPYIAIDSAVVHAEAAWRRAIE